MSDILSQEEVDALLSAVSSGGVETGKKDVKAQPEVAGAERSVVLYDFRRPDRVSKDQMRTLQNLHEGYARLFSTSLTSYLRTLVEIELISVDQLTYSEFIMSISNPSCIYTFQMEPLEGNAILEINPSLVFFMIDRLFGGQGKPSEQNRELTNIERNVVNRITERALVDLKEIWEHIGIFNPRIESYETNPQFVQVAPPGETVILISLEVRMPNGSGLMSLCFPYIMLESIISKLSGESWIAAMAQPTEENKRLMSSEIQPLAIKVQVLLGRTTITVRDLLQLHIGDILCLDIPAKGDLVIQIEEKDKFSGRPGLVGRHKAVQIKDIYRREGIKHE